MKNRAFLSILEQLCMILIFAVVAAVCLRVFSLANEISKDRDRLDRAVITAQYTAELLKSSKGDLEACADALSGSVDGNTLTVFCDSSGQPSDAGTKEYFKLVAVKTASSHPYTERAQITVIGDGETVFSVDVVWQTENRS